MHDKDFSQIVLKFNGIINKIARIEKKVVFAVDGIRLTTQQIHLIDIIGKISDVNVTELAKISGVTKGAVSQKLTWLEKKGFIIKVRDNGNNRETFVKLTNLGMEAFNAHLAYHEEFDKELFSMFENISKENVEFLNLLLERLDHVFTRIVEK